MSDPTSLMLLTWHLQAACWPGAAKDIAKESEVQDCPPERSGLRTHLLKALGAVPAIL